MKTKFRIVPERNGIHYELEYRSTFAGAVKRARHRGFRDLSEIAHSHNLKPDRVRISIRVESPYGDHWVDFAIVTESCVEVIEAENRNDVSRLKQRIAALQSELESKLSQIKEASASCG